MKKLFLSAISIALATSAYAIPNTFKEGDVISAEQMNENFEYLEQQFRGARSTDVKCGEGEKIGDAISNGYTNITVSGSCTENLQFSMWREDSAENSSPTGKLAPRFLRIAGADASAKIADASSNAESTVSVTDGATLLLEDITISGGQYAVNAQRNTNLYLSGVTIENFTERGIRAIDGNWLGIDDDGVIVKGTGSAGYGIEVGLGASGWIAAATISGVERGLNAHGGSTLYIKSYEITAASRGVNVSNSRFLKYSDGSASIEGTSDSAVSVDHGVFTNWDGTLEIKNLNGGRGVELWQSKASISNLKLLNFNNTGSGWNPAIRVGDASALNLNDSEVSGETDSSLINVDRSSMMEVNNSNISGTAGDSLIYAGRQSLLDLEDSTVSGTARSLIGIDRGSTLQIESGTLSGTVQDALIGINHGSNAEINDKSVISITSAAAGIYVGGSNLNFKNSSISGSVTQHLIGIENGSDAEISDSTLTLTSGKKGLSVAKNSHLKLRNSSITGPATDALVQINRVSSVDIENGSTLGQTNADTPDVKVDMLSFLGVWDSETSINKVNCSSKSHVETDEGTVTDLDPSCTE